MRGVAAFALLLGLSACAGGGAARQDTFPDGLVLKPIPQPSDVIATELAFARAAREEGQWTAFSRYAAPDAVLFAPSRVDAATWLKDRPNPPRSVDWQPREMWLSCDGSIAVTRGAWYRWDGTEGWYSIVWQRQRDGSFKWVVDHGDVAKKAPRASEFVDTKVAVCPADPWPPSMTLSTVEPGAGEWFGGASADATLRWGGRVDQWGGRIVTVDVWNGREFERVMHETVSPPPGSVHGQAQ